MPFYFIIPILKNAFIFLDFVRVDIAAQLDEGKGLAKTVADIKDANKRGAIHFAAREGKTEVCKYLLEELKLNVDTKDEDGMHLIFFISLIAIFFFLSVLCSFCSKDALTYLLESLKISGETPLLHAARQGHTLTTKYLLDRGANPAIPSDLGATALHHSAGIGVFSLACLFLFRGRGWFLLFLQF